MAGTIANWSSLVRHTWYLHPYLVIFALVDPRYPGIEGSRGQQSLFNIQARAQIECQVEDINVLIDLNFSEDKPLSLVTQPWLVSNILNHQKAGTQWVKIPQDC